MDVQLKKILQINKQSLKHMRQISSCRAGKIIFVVFLICAMVVVFMGYIITKLLWFLTLFFQSVKTGLYSFIVFPKYSMMCGDLWVPGRRLVLRTKLQLSAFSFPVNNNLFLSFLYVSGRLFVVIICFFSFCV